MAGTDSRFPRQVITAENQSGSKEGWQRTRDDKVSPWQGPESQKRTRGECEGEPRVQVWGARCSWGLAAPYRNEKHAGQVSPRRRSAR